MGGKQTLDGEALLICMGPRARVEKESHTLSVSMFINQASKHKHNMFSCLGKHTLEMDLESQV